MLTFEFDGRDEQVLKYEHFSVLMSTSRRLCRFSAVNIDGNLSKSFARVGWRSDPRIPATPRSGTSATATRRSSRAAT